MKSKETLEGSNLELIAQKETAVAQRDFYTEEAEWLRKAQKSSEEENRENKALLEFLEISKSKDPDEALSKYLDFLSSHFSPTSEIKLYTSKAGGCLDCTINEFLGLDLKFEDLILKIETGFRNMNSLTDIIKETMYMMVVGKKPIRVDNTKNPFGYLRAHKIIFNSMTKGDLQVISGGSGIISEQKFQKLMSLVGKVYNEKEVDLADEDIADRNFYEKYIMKIKDNIDAKMRSSVRKSHYTCPIIIDEGAVGDIHISHEKNLSDLDCRTIDHLAYYVSIAMEKILASTTDSLTQLVSRAHLDRELPRIIEYNKRYGRPVTVVMADIDRFKKVNDMLGHQFGDAVLKEVGGIINSSVRKSVDLAARYGGEEILICFPEISSKKALELVEGIREKIEHAEINYGGKRKKVTVSSGIYTMNSNSYKDLSLEQIKDKAVKNADIALYYSKEKGRNRTTAYSETVRKEYEAIKKAKQG
ncbi:GGDEF domain-containing protein [Candidatus Woesearchaeota archaeon]|nr:GGDEF domain-containing protein [Candidatus Woesearchaeota archaeon]